MSKYLLVPLSSSTLRLCDLFGLHARSVPLVPVPALRFAAMEPCSLISLLTKSCDTIASMLFYLPKLVL
jgi:hypothetical protein